MKYAIALLIALAVGVVSGQAEEAPPMLEPYTQADLALIVANVQRPNGMTFFDGHIYTVCNGDWTIYRINTATEDTISFVYGVKDGNSFLVEGTDAGLDIWAPDPNSNTLWRLDHRRESPVAVAGELAAPWGIARLDDNHLLVSDTRDNAIYRISEIGRKEAVASGFRAPTGLAVDDNRLYIANGGSARRGIEWIAFDADNEASEPATLVNGIQNASNIALASDGYLYFAYALGTRGVIGRVDPRACLDEPCGNADVEMVIFSDLPAPIAFTLSPGLRLYLHSRYRPEIYWLQLPTDAA